MLPSRSVHLLQLARAWGATSVCLAALLGAPSPLRSSDAIRLQLKEVSEEWGLEFRHHHGGSGERYMPESVVGGVVIFDYDGDGDPDVFFVDAAALPGYEGPEPRSRLFRNDGAAGFVDVTDASGIRVTSYGAGGTAGDVDGDGDADLYVTAFGSNHLFRNNGDGTFTEITDRAGVGDQRWSASAAFADLDRDGDLDLYVVNYVDFTLETHKFCGDREAGIQGYCHPDAYEGVPDTYYRNRGDGTFDEATGESGLAAHGRAGLGVVVADVDSDGWPDVYVSNDAEPNFLFLNRGDGTFEDASLLSGTAHSDRGRAEGGMGVESGDVDGDGRLDLLVTNFEFESNALYRNTGDGLFVDGRYATNIAEPSLPMLAFGVVLADLDQDADLDLAIGNGHILDNADVFNPRSRHAQPNQVLVNTGGGRFEPAPETGFEAPVQVTRALASGDLDGDGDLDLVAVNQNERATVYENRTAGAGGWLRVDLRPAPEGRSAVGSRLTLRPIVGGSAVQVREVRTASSYLAQNEAVVHFGLGDADQVGALEVRWPDGGRREVRGIPVNRRIVLVQHEQHER